MRSKAMKQLSMLLFLVGFELSGASNFFWLREGGDQFDNGQGVRQGNGVVLSQDETTLWVTNANGAMRIIDLQDATGGTEILFQPTPLTGRRIVCRSSVDLYQPNGEAEYGVYSIIDMPQDENLNISSRLLAVSPSGRPLWEAFISGVAEGTPRIGVDGTYVYLTHNEKSPNSERYNYGMVTRIGHDPYGVMTKVNIDAAGVFGLPQRLAPFAPLALNTANDEDMLYFGEAWDNGTATFGLLYRSNGTEVQGLMRTSWSTATAPVVSLDGKSMWIGGAASNVHGWTNGRSFTNQPSWTASLGSRDKTLPLPPLATKDGRLLFAITEDNILFCLNASTGHEIWTNDGRLVSHRTMALSRNEGFLFTIGSNERIVTQFDAETGRVLSQTSCSELYGEESCETPVEGSIAVSSQSVIYFGGVHGKIGVVEMDQIEYPLSPTFSPSFSPTDLPSKRPSLSPSDEISAQPSASPSAFPSIEMSNEPSAIPSTFPSSVPSPLETDAPALMPYPSAPSTLLSPAVIPTMLNPSSPIFQDQITYSPVTGIPSADFHPYFPIEPAHFPDTHSSSRPTQVAPVVNLDLFKTDLKSMMEDESSDNSNEGVASLIVTSVILMGALLLVGIVIGKALQSRRETNPVNNVEVSNETNEWKPGLTVHLFDKDWSRNEDKLMTQKLEQMG